LLNVSCLGGQVHKTDSADKNDMPSSVFCTLQGRCRRRARAHSQVLAGQKQGLHCVVRAWMWAHGKHKAPSRASRVSAENRRLKERASRNRESRPERDHRSGDSDPAAGRRRAPLTLGRGRWPAPRRRFYKWAETTERPARLGPAAEV